MICANIDNSIQVHITQRRSSNGFVTKMKCEITSNTTHGVLISKKIGFKSYKEICSGEKKRVNLGYNNDKSVFNVENNTLAAYPQSCGNFPLKNNHIYQPISPCIHGFNSYMSWAWEVFSKFFSIYNIEPNWLDCDYNWGSYDAEFGNWTGCMGKV